MKGSELAHNWAYQTKEHGRASSMFYEGDSIYSYGHHFKIARIYKPDNFVLFTSRSYSSATAKHKSRVHSAVSHLTVITVPNVDAVDNSAHETNLSYLIKEIEENLQKSVRARTNSEYYANEADELLMKMKYYISLLKVNLNKLDKTLVKTVKDYLKREGKLLSPEVKQAIADKLKQAQIRAIEKRKEDIADFHNFKRDSIHGINKAFLRYNIVFEKIETSLNVSVPSRLCRVLYNKIKSGQDVKGFKLEQYTVISLNGDLKIGCHNIPRSEIDYIANVLNW